MPRQLRKDYPGAVHHVFVRGVARSAIAVDVADYERALFLLGKVAHKFEIRCHAWCFLPNHTHLLVTSELGNLSRAMHWLGTCTAQSFNRRYERIGHLYQGRFGSRFVKDESHLLELARYLPLNPVRAGLCVRPEEWMWSSYAATVGLQPAPWFLRPEAFLTEFASNDAYVEWVAHGIDATILDARGRPVAPPSSPSLAALLAPADLTGAMAHAHFDHGFSQAAIARHLDIPTSTVNGRLARHVRGNALR